MSGGIAYVLDEDDTFKSRCNMAMIELEPVPEEGQVAEQEFGHYNARPGKSSQRVGSK
jgi:glutamate synthase (NADPH/NADH) large chain